MSLYLHGLGHFHPEVEITNRFLEDLDIGTSDDWILERVGIRARRTLLPLDYIRDTRNRDPRMAGEAQLYGNAETGRRAAEMAIARAGIDRRDIGMVISGSSAPDMVTPADACTIAAALGLEVPCFDVNSACTSFHVAMHLLSMMDPEKVPRFVLSVVPEGVTRTVDYSDRTAAVLWGDGTSAAVLSTREPGRARILGNTLESSPAGHDKVTIPRQGHFLQEGRTVQMFAIKKTVKCYRHLRDGFAEAGRRLHFVGHQANLMMLDKVCELCEVPKELHHHNVEDFGNTAGAGSVGVLSMRWDDWTDGDDVAVAGVGAGLTWSSFLLRFGVGLVEVRGLPPALELRPPGAARLRPRTAGRGPARGLRREAPASADADGRPDRRDPPRAPQGPGRRRARHPARRLVLPVPLPRGPRAAGVPRGRRGVAAHRLLLRLGGRARDRPRPRLRRGRVRRPDPPSRRRDALRDRRSSATRSSPASGAAVAVGDATVAVDGDVIYTIKRAKVGIFRDIDYADYPWPSERSRGGRMER